MRNQKLNLFSLFLGVLMSPALLALDYPAAPRGDVVDEYHGVKVADPYRWLEDVDDPKVLAWVAAENRLTQQQLADIPGRKALRQRLETLWNYEKYGVPEEVAGALYYTYNNGLQDQSVLLREQAGERRVVLDPNQLSSDGTRALTSWEVSPDGRYLAYGLAEAGSDWNRFYVRDLHTGKDAAQVLDYIKFSGMSWSKDSKGFFYSRYPGSREVKSGDSAQAEVFSELRNQALYYHQVGTPQADDVLIMADAKHPKRGFSGEVSADGRYLLISIWQGATEENALYVRDLAHPQSPFLRGRLIRLVDDFHAKYEPIGVHGHYLYALTTDGAPRGRIVRLDLQHPGRQQQVIAQSDYPIEQAKLVGEHLLLTVMKDAVHKISIYPRDGSSSTPIVLPGLGSVTGMRASSDAQRVYFSYASFLNPPQQMQLNLANASVSTLNAAKLPIDTANLVAEQVFYPSKDGTQIPMFLLRRKDITSNKPHPSMLYGYGGFAISLTPSFKPERLAWLEQGGVYAIANLRGGGEYGEAWHQAGTLKNKQNVFDDFAAAAKYLIAQGWTSADQLAVSGRSNGGLLVAAVSNQNPELFAAALPGVGVLDMLRFHKFTIGWAWTGDYGSSDDAKMFPALRAYSPLHNVPTGSDYPATLITTADHDDRVVPGHSFKFAAALQHANPGAAPKLIRIESRAGHGSGMPTSKKIDQATDEMAFAAHHTGLEFKRNRSSNIPWQKMLEQSVLNAP